jgi:hypothetical protein
LHKVDILHALGVKLDIASFVPVIQLCNDAASGDIPYSRSRINVDVDPGLGFLRCSADAVAGRCVVGGKSDLLVLVLCVFRGRLAEKPETQL